MMTSNARGIKYTVAAALNLPNVASHIPNVGGKMFRLTSESSGRIG